MKRRSSDYENKDAYRKVLLCANSKHATRYLPSQAFAPRLENGQHYHVEPTSQEPFSRKKFQLNLPALMTIPSGQREEEIDRRIVKGFDNYRGIVNQHIEKGIVIVNQNYKRRLSWSAEKKQGMQLS